MGRLASARPGSRRQRRLQLAFRNHPLMPLGMALDTVMRLDLVLRHQPGDLVGAGCRLADDPGNERDRLTDLELMHHGTFLEFGCRPPMGGDQAFCFRTTKCERFSINTGNARVRDYRAVRGQPALLENSGLPCYDPAALIVLSYHHTQLKLWKQRTGG